MATIALYASKIRLMDGLIEDVKKSVTDYKSELSTLGKKCLSINKSVCNLEDVISSIQSSSQTQEQKITSLETFQQNSEDFIEDAARIDGNVAEVVNKRKDDFYEKYNYLKPNCEKSGWEKFCDGCKAVGEWCKENWKSICNIVLVIAAVVAVVAICVLSLGLAAVPAVVITAFVGAAVGMVGQFISDCITSIVVGELCFSSWQTYFGAFVGGAVSGILMFTGNSVAACMADAAISTLCGQSLENITGGEQRSNSEIWMNTAISAGVAGLLSKGFDKMTKNLSAKLAKTFPALRRLAGRGSYEASFKMVLTKLSKGQINNYTSKTIRNGIVSGLEGSVLEQFFSGFSEGLKEWYEKWELLS